MIFDRYDNKVELTYQISLIQSLSYLNKMYALELSDDHKNTLVEALIKQDPLPEILTEIPPLIFMLHVLQTESNKDQIFEIVQHLSSKYLEVIGERVDVLQCSNLLSGWAEIGFRDEQLFEKLANIVVEKQSKESFFAKGDTIAMVNILKAMSEIDLENDDFLTTILEPVVENFNELKITWAITLMRTLGTMSLGN